MNKDREELDRQLEVKNAHFRLPGSNSSVWERLSRRQVHTMRTNLVEAWDGCPRPACFHAHAAEYSRQAFEAARVGSVPPIPAAATELLSYHDPGGAATMSELERLTLTMVNNHDADGKLAHQETRDQMNRRLA